MNLILRVYYKHDPEETAKKVVDSEAVNQDLKDWIDYLSVLMLWCIVIGSVAVLFIWLVSEETAKKL